MGSLSQSPYVLVGGERALTHIDSVAFNSVVPNGISGLSNKRSLSGDESEHASCDGCFGTESHSCCVCGIYKVGGCAHALARLGPVQSLVALGTDLCGANHLETRVDFGDTYLRRVVVSAPPHSKILVGSTIEYQVFKDLPCDKGSVCACRYNPVLNPTVPFCKSVSDDPSLWFDKVISPKLSLEDASLDEITVFKVSKDVVRIFKEASLDLSQFAQCGFDFLCHIINTKVNVAPGVIKECPLKDHCRVFF